MIKEQQQNTLISLLDIKKKTMQGLTNIDAFEWMLSQFDMVLTCQSSEDPEVIKNKHYGDDKTIIFLQRDKNNEVLITPELMKRMCEQLLLIYSN